MKTLDNKWALVTGSSRGIGQQIALGLARRNCNVIVHGRTPSSTEKTIQLLRDLDVEIHSVSGDLGTGEGIASVIDGVKSGPGYVDILYNNAAIMNTWNEIWQIPMDQWQQVFQVNLFTVVQLCNEFVPGMIERKFGRVINLTSGIQDTPQLAPYSVSKAGIDKYTKDLAAELKDLNVLVNHVDPGWLKTDMGGENAEHEVETVLPGALVPALLEDNGPSGRFYAAQDFKYLD